MPKDRSRPSPSARLPLFPSSFGWLSGPGVYHGRVDAAFGADTVTVDCQLLQYPAGAEGGGAR